MPANINNQNSDGSHNWTFRDIDRECKRLTCTNTPDRGDRYCSTECYKADNYHKL